MVQTLLAAVGAGVLGIAYLIHMVYKKRSEMAGLPSPPVKNFLFGNLDVAEECTRLFPPGCHPHNWFNYIQKKYDLGDYFYLDWWPFGPRWFFIADPEAASHYVTTTTSLPKSPLTKDYLDMFLGDQNMVSVEGQQWKTMRSIFNPGFSASHLMTLVPYIVDASVVFDESMQKFARTNEKFELEEHATRLTIDIIGKVVLDADFDSQKGRHPIVDTFRKRAYLMPESSNPVLDFLTKFQFIRRYKLWRNGHELDRLIGEELDRKIASRAAAADSQPKSFKERKRSVIDLALDAYNSEVAGHEQKQAGSKTMDANFRRMAVDSMKTFIFAGHDTTASTIAYLFYLVHFYPKVHKKMVDEINVYFGADATAAEIGEAIKAEPHIINKLEYITAVIKETLRIFPPASTLRTAPAQTDPNKVVYLTDPKTGQKLPLSGFEVWPIVALINRNADFFPEPEHFVPERFLPAQTPFPHARLFTPAGKDAWRPFEKGPRNCIGQELAMIEAKIIVAMTVRRYDFVCEIDGVVCDALSPLPTSREFADGAPGAARMTIEGHRPFQILRGAAKPRDGMPGRLSIRAAKEYTQ